MRYALLALACLLAGCATGWEPRDTSWRAERIEVHYVNDPRVFCPNARAAYLVGCTVRVNEQMRAVVYIRKGLTGMQLDCALEHELAHALGRNHKPDAGPQCGPSGA